MSDWTNADRANAAFEALFAYASVAYVSATRPGITREDLRTNTQDPIGDPQKILQDLLGDLRHLAAGLGMDYQEASTLGYGNFRREVNNESLDGDLIRLLIGMGEAGEEDNAIWLDYNGRAYVGEYNPGEYSPHELVITYADACAQIGDYPDAEKFAESLQMS